MLCVCVLKKPGRITDSPACLQAKKNRPVKGGKANPEAEK